MQRLPVARHRRAGQARATYRACSHPVAKTRWHAIGLRLRGDRPRCPAEVAEVVGRSALTVRDALRRCNAHGPGGPADRRQGHGAKPQLTAGPRAELFAARRRDGAWHAAGAGSVVVLEGGRTSRYGPGQTVAGVPQPDA